MQWLFEFAAVQSIISGLLGGLLSGTFLAAILGSILQSRTARLQNEIKSQFDRQNAIFTSQRKWKEAAVSRLLGPMYMQLDRTQRAFARWKAQDVFLEANVIRRGNEAIRDLLITQAHFIPVPLLEDAGKLVEHYDRWLEEFERKRLAETPDLETPFIFVGPQGFPFPRQSEARFRAAFLSYIAELSGEEEGATNRASEQS